MRCLKSQGQKMTNDWALFGYIEVLFVFGRLSLIHMTHTLGVNALDSSPPPMYTYTKASPERERSLCAADGLQHKQLGCYCYGRRLNCLTLLQFKLSKEINTRHIKHQQPEPPGSPLFALAIPEHQRVAFNSLLLLRLSEWDALLWIKTKRRLNAVSVRCSAPMHFSRNEVVWPTMKE